MTNRLYAVAGKKGSGKDTFADALGLFKVDIGGALRDVVASVLVALGVDPIAASRYVTTDKEVPIPQVDAQTARRGMQEFGNAGRRWCIGLWTRLAVERAASLEAAGFGSASIICGIRYLDEVQTVLGAGGTVFILHRNEGVHSDAHESERCVEQLYDLEHERVVHVHNTDWTKEQLQAYAKEATSCAK